MNRQMLKYGIEDFDNKNIALRKKFITANYKMHWHECCELELILSGKGRQLLNGSEYPLKEGELYFLTPADCHAVYVDEPMEILGIMFEDRMLSRSIWEQILKRESLGVNLTARLGKKEYEAVSGLVAALMCENERSDVDSGEAEFGNLYVGHIIDCMVIELLRSCRTDNAAIEKSPIGEAILYLHRLFTEEITLDRLAELTHLSRNYFSELFRSYTGHTFKSYLIEIRMRNACRMLTNTEMSVTDICYSCGFESFSNFMRTFKAKYGKSPLKFRAENNTNKMI